MPNPLPLLKQVREARRQPGAALYEVLAARTLKNADNPRVVTQQDVLMAFAATGFDYVGQVSTGYSAYGLKVAANVSVDLAALFAPGFVTLEVGGGLSGEGTKNLLLVMARLPAAIATRTAGQVNLTNDDRCAFMALRGAAWTLAARGSAKAGVSVGFSLDAKKGFDHDIKSREQLDAEKAAADAQHRTLGEKLGDGALECVAISAKAEASASLSASYAGTYMFLRDQFPTSYPTWTDAKLAARFAECTGVGEKGMIKARIQSLFTSLPALWASAPAMAWYESLGKAITGGRVDFARLEAGLGKARAILQGVGLLDDRAAAAMLSRVRGALAETKTLLGRSYFSRRGDEGKAALKGTLKTLFAERTLEAYLPEARGVGPEVKMSRWKTALDEAESLLALTADKRRAILEEIDHHLATIRAFKEYDRAAPGGDMVASGSAELLFTGLCYLSLWGHSPEVGAEARAGVEASALTFFSGEASAAASARKSWKWTHYRFQQYVKSRGGAGEGVLPCVVITQDTSIAYTQTVLAATATATLTGLGGKEKSAKKIYQAMSYQSSHVYWSHPAGPGPTGTVKVTSMPGSGFAFGQSVMLGTLCEQGRAATPEARAYRTVVASTLNVTVAQLEEFLAQSWVVDAAGELPQDVILLEATFAAPGVELRVDFEGGQANRPVLEKDARDTVVAGARGAPGKNLESLRIRYRIADDKETRTPFKLGIPAGPVKVGITLEAATRAGAHGIVDLDCYWFSDPTRNTDPMMASRRDDTVPPVILLHQ
jgi:hypothetical protein